MANIPAYDTIVKMPDRQGLRPSSQQPRADNNRGNTFKVLCTSEVMLAFMVVGHSVIGGHVVVTVTDSIDVASTVPSPVNMNLPFSV